MRKLFLIFALINFVFGQQIPYNVPFDYQEVPIYKSNILDNSVALKMDYARWIMHNSTDWDTIKTRKKIIGIDLVFTKEPLNYELWTTPYYDLMRKRLDELFALDTSIQKDATIKWNLILQTQCKNRDEAKQLFHGFVIKYKTISLIDSTNFTELQSRNFELVKNLIKPSYTLKDSLVIRTLIKHPEWTNILAVLDWTGSMYGYSAQVVKWFESNLDRGQLKHLVLFNDGDDYLDKDPMNKIKKIGETGGIYFMDDPKNLEDILEKMETAMLAGDGFEPTENDVEAILKGLDKYNDVSDVVLIADNTAPVRDLILAEKVNKPVRIILCGKTPNIILRDYVNLAWKTGGSLIYQDSIYSFKKPKEEILNFTFMEKEFVFKEAEGFWDWVERVDNKKL